MKYPKTLSELHTIERILAGDSIARFGDGEWRLALGSACTSQRAEKGIEREMQQVLRAKERRFIVGIPNLANCPRRESWERYAGSDVLSLLDPGIQYASSFITRPDNAPWIDTPKYWALVNQIWKGREVVLVVGQDRSGTGPEQKSLTSEMLMESGANSVATVIGPRQHAYKDIDSIEALIFTTACACAPMQPIILMCLGATATCLALRLHRRGLQAVDMGHLGMFMKHAGSYKYTKDDLTSPAYRHQLETLHKARSWGADGGKHVAAVERIAAQMDAVTILDYGCGENKLADGVRASSGRRVSGYDPGIAERSAMPKPCDLVVCTDVLEHVEPEKLGAVLDHIHRLTARRAYFVISTKEANATLPDGRNAHLIVRDPDWWENTITHAGFSIETMFEHKKDIEVIAVKRHEQQR